MQARGPGQLFLPMPTFSHAVQCAAMPERRHEPSRLEAFSDAVFAFALTLMVVSLEVPKSFDELLEQMRGFIGFALMFAMVCYIWWEHNKFFRRYGLQDAWTAFLNCVLLFVVLFYVYPLKFLTTAFFDEIFHPGKPGGVNLGNGRQLMLLYSSGVLMIFGTFVFLYRHAWRKRRELDLSPSAEIELRYGQRAHLLSATLGVISIVLALSVPARWLAISGIMYMLMGPVHAMNGIQASRAHDRLKKAEANSHAQR